MFDGLEVDMLSLGNADCLIVSRWNGFNVTRVLIDGGNGDDARKVRAFLLRRGISHLDAVVGTHMHNDHVAGLINLVQDESISIGRAFVHIPQNHVQMARVERALRVTAGTTEAECVEKTLQASQDLVAALSARSIPITEPFQGTIVGPLTVVGPSESYYEELVHQFEDADAIRSIAQGNLNYTIESAIDDALIKTGVLAEVGLLESPETTPENNSSVILATVFNQGKYLFTSDAGVPALKLALAAYDLSGCYWMQVPHHGSRRNITAELIEHFSPRLAYVSASGSVKHPRRAIVNAFKKAGATVYSTHYPTPTSLWNHNGTVPSRSDYGGAVALYEKDEETGKVDPATLDALSKLLFGASR